MGPGTAAEPIQFRWRFGGGLPSAVKSGYSIPPVAHTAIKGCLVASLTWLSTILVLSMCSVSLDQGRQLRRRETSNRLIIRLGLNVKCMACPLKKRLPKNLLADKI